MKNNGHEQMNKHPFISFCLFLMIGLIGIGEAQASESFRLSSLDIRSGDRVHSFTIEIAETTSQRSQGLQYRKVMASDHGMLFDFKKSVPVTMWMKNTSISLDILFISKQGIIVNIARNTKPYSLGYINAAGRVKGALELLAGTTNRLNIKAGDTIIHPLF